MNNQKVWTEEELQEAIKTAEPIGLNPRPLTDDELRVMYEEFKEELRARGLESLIPVRDANRGLESVITNGIDKLSIQPTEAEASNQQK